MPQRQVLRKAVSTERWSTFANLIPHIPIPSVLSTELFSSYSFFTFHIFPFLSSMLCSHRHPLCELISPTAYEPRVVSRCFSSHLRDLKPPPLLVLVEVGDVATIDYGGEARSLFAADSASQSTRGRHHGHACGFSHTDDILRVWC